MILGTAGHVDHGKTALVRALTGVDTDRLKVEKERGITTELGFAPLRLEEGRTASVVDVPGHERFVASMAAGAGGVDVALLVVAVDEGVMPQTREHIDICALLGVRAGILVLSKADLAPSLAKDRFVEVEAALRSVGQGSVFERAPAVRVSARTGEGIEHLRREIALAVAGLAPRPADGLFAMGVDRAFTLKGFGTVVTGTVSTGELSVDSEVALLPGPLGPFRVRGLQQHGRAVHAVRAGERAAINLTGLEVSQASRGLVVARPGTLRPSGRLDVELRCVRAAPGPLGARDAFVCHAGTASAACRVALLGERQLAPGGAAYAQLVLERPLAVWPGQRFLLRGFRSAVGHGRTVAGGQVLRISAPRRRPAAAHELGALGFDDLPRRIVTLVEVAGGEGLTAGELLWTAGAGRGAIELALSQLVAAGKLSRREERWVAVPRASAGAEASAAKLEAGRGRPLTTLEEAILGELRRAELSPPSLTQLAARLRPPGVEPLERTLEGLVARGLVVRAGDGLFFEAERVKGLRARLVEHLRSHGSISISDFKTLTGGSRRFAIPLSELFDRERLTLRVGDRRVLRGRNR